MMPLTKIKSNTILHGNVLDVLKTIPNDFVQCIITSPPYWGLRKYSTEPKVWDGDSDCIHDWKDVKGDAFCKRGWVSLVMNHNHICM